MDGAVNNGLTSLLLGLVFIIQGVFFALSAHQRRAISGVRFAVTLAYPTFALSFFADKYYEAGSNLFDWFLMMLALALVPFLLCANYFVNRRRARCQPPTAS